MGHLLAHGPPDENLHSNVGWKPSLCASLHNSQNFFILQEHHFTAIEKIKPSVVVFGLMKYDDCFGWKIFFDLLELLSPLRH